MTASCRLWGANSPTRYKQGWDRQVIATGAAAKATKRMINGERIYPPRTRHPEDILAAAAPVIQAPPEVGGKGQRPPRATEQ